MKRHKCAVSLKHRECKTLAYLYTVYFSRFFLDCLQRCLTKRRLFWMKCYKLEYLSFPLTLMFTLVAGSQANGEGIVFRNNCEAQTNYLWSASGESLIPNHAQYLDRVEKTITFCQGLCVVASQPHNRRSVWCNWGTPRSDDESLYLCIVLRFNLIFFEQCKPAMNGTRMIYIRLN